MENSIGKTIRELRLERGLTQEALAELIGVTAKAVSKWENGGGLPDISQILPLAQVFGVSTDVILGAVDDGAAAEEVDSFIGKWVNDSEASYDEQHAACLEILKRYPTNVDLLRYTEQITYAAVVKYYDSGDARLDATVAEFERVANLVIRYAEYPYDNISKSNLVDIYSKVGRVSDAIKLAETFENPWISRDEVFTTIFYRTGEVEKELELREKIVRQALNAASIHINNAASAYYFSAKRIPEVIEAYKLLIALYEIVPDRYMYPSSYSILHSYSFLARCYLLLGDADAALEWYGRIDVSEIRNKSERVLGFADNEDMARQIRASFAQEVGTKSEYDGVRNNPRIAALLAL